MGVSSLTKPQSPELLLPTLNSKVLSLLQLAEALGGQTEENSVQQLKHVLAKLHIMELLRGAHCVVAVAGMQGSGKSTLIKQFLRLDQKGLFPENAGRGERLPILISSSGDSSCTCCVKRWQDRKLVLLDLAEEDFYMAAKAPGPEDVLLELRVPWRADIPEHLAFLLLPGFDAQGGHWQDVMGVSLASAASCIFVFDRTGYSDDRNRQLMKHIRQDFMAARPIFVVAKSDGCLHGNRELAAQVIADFDVKEPERVICTGTTEELQREWVPRLVNALEVHSGTPREFRVSQLAMLRGQLKTDLLQACACVRDSVRSLHIEVDGTHAAIKEVLDAYDREAVQTKRAFRQAYGEVLNGRHGDAINKLRDTAKNGTAWDRICDWAKDAWDGPGAIARAERAIGEFWEEAKPITCADDVVLALNEVMSKRLFVNAKVPSRRDWAGDHNSQVLRRSSEVTPKLARESLEMYGHQRGAGVQLLGDFDTDKELLQAIAFLVLPGVASRDGETDATGRPQGQLGGAAKILPALALEYVRLVAIAPAMRGVHGAFAAVDSRAAGGQLSDTFEAATGRARKVIGGIGILLGLDGAVDGKIDSIAALAGGLTGGSAASGATRVLVSGASWVLAAGVAFGSTLAEANRHALKKDAAFRLALGHVRDRELEARMASVERLLEDLRQVVEERLRHGFKISSRTDRWLRLNHALDCVQDAREEILEAINEHPAIALR